MTGRGFAGYLASVRAEEDRCICGHVRRSHALIFHRRRAGPGGTCQACTCERFKRPPLAPSPNVEQ